MSCLSRKRRTVAKSAAITPQTLDTISGLILDVRARLDDLEFALEDAASENGSFTMEANRADGRTAAYEARQSLRAVERELDQRLVRTG